MRTKFLILFTLFLTVSMTTSRRLRGIDLNEEFSLLGLEEAFEECELIEFENEYEWDYEENAEDLLVKENGKNFHVFLANYIFRHNNEIY